MNPFRISTFLSLLVVYSLSSCHNNRKLLAEEIRYLYVDYDTYTPSNIGIAFKGSISAKMYSGESIQFKNNKGLRSSENFSLAIKQEKLFVAHTLPNFKTTKIPITLAFTDKKEATVTSSDTIILNFRGNSMLNAAGENGKHGPNGSSGSTPILFRDGKDGDQGSPGTDGTNGETVEIHTWKSNDTIFIHVLNITQNTTWRTMLVGSNAVFTIDVSGGAGGSGGIGGSGGDGKNGVVDEKRSKLPGNGGHGGHGGYGGRGGNGGNVLLYIHPSLTNSSQILSNIEGGNGGRGGTAGKGGKAGTPATGQSASPAGNNGMSGQNGIQGTLTTFNQEFDTSIY